MNVETMKAENTKDLHEQPANPVSDELTDDQLAKVAGGAAGIQALLAVSAQKQSQANTDAL
jgi:hypothetical protein